MNREQIGKFLILRELQHKDTIGQLNEKGTDVLIMLKFDEDDLDHKEMKEVLEYIDKLETNQNQKAIECLKELKEKLYDSAIQVVGTGVNAVRLYSIDEIFDNKIKELEIKKWH